MKNKFFALLLAAVTILSVWSVSAFADEEDTPTAATTTIQYVQPPFSGTPTQILAQMRAQLAAAYQRNSDIVGYLYIPGTSICEPVVQTADNNFYLRRNYLGKESYEGCYYLDYSASTGNRNEISRNTVIYGHSMDENPNGTRFSQLKKYLYPEFAEVSPYIYYCTLTDDMVWQIFASYYINTKYPYNIPDLDDSWFTAMVSMELQRSRLLYSTKVSAQDKILTLSTCTYALDASYPNNHRFVVAAKLLAPNTAMEAVSVQANPNPVGPD